MKKNTTILFSIILVFFVALTIGYSNDSSSVSKKNIEKFLKNKSKLYKEQEAIVNNLYILDNIENEDMTDLQTGNLALHEILKDIKDLLTEEEYKRIVSNRYLVDEDLIHKNYDKSEIKAIKYKEKLKDKEKIIYYVYYTERLYSAGQLKLEKERYGEFTLKRINNDWLISYINY